MEDNRNIKIINGLNGEIITVKTYEQAKETINDILLGLIDTYYNSDLNESLTYINITNLTIQKNDYSEEESIYKSVYIIDNTKKQVKDPYSVY